MMRDYRLWAGLCAVLIALAGVLVVTAGGTPPLPPPVAVRGPVSAETTPLAVDGLELVPPTVAELAPPASAAASPDLASADTADTPPSTSIESPDQTMPFASDAKDSPDEQDPVSDEQEVASTDSPDAVVPPPVDSPDSPDSADSPDG